MKIVKRILVILVTVSLFSSFEDRQVTWVAIGDSITYLNDHTDETANRVTKGYLTDVTDNLPDWHYINKGYNGWTAGKVADHIEGLGLVKADVYSILLGTNDWWQGRPVGVLEDYKAGNGNSTLYGSFRTIIDKLRRLNPLAQIVLITPMQRADFVYVNDAKNNAFGSYKTKNGQRLEAFAAAIDSIAAYEHIAVVDLYHNKELPVKKMVNFKRLKDPGSGLYKDYKFPASTKIAFDPIGDEYPYPKEAINLTYDGLHPSDKGNAIIGRALTARFKQLDLPVIPSHTSAGADTIRWKKYIDLETYTRPFWMTDTITDETALVIRNGDTATAGLLFKAKKILSVKAADHGRIFKKGKDWDYKGGKLTFGPASSVPFFHPKDLVFNKKVPGVSMDGKTPGTYVLFNEGYYFSTKQIAVTYIKDRSEIWHGPIPRFAGTGLPNTIARLENKKSLKVEFYGNSIEVGHNASGFERVPPYMPAWPELVIRKLQERYHVDISFINRSVAGRLAKWGRDSVSARVVVEKTDLVIIGFGMNDGTMKVPADIYREQIRGMMDSVNIEDPGAEFILIAPMLANPASTFDGLQASYRQELDKLTRKGVVVADLTGVHEELLRHKSYQDMTGNNINHPNDYLARWYAQFICGLLIK